MYMCGLQYMHNDILRNDTAAIVCRPGLDWLFECVGAGLHEIMSRLDLSLCCSDILTPLPALGVPFEIDDVKGPIIEHPITSMEAVQQLHALDLDQLTFVGDALKTLRQEVGDQVRTPRRTAEHGCIGHVRTGLGQADEDGDQLWTPRHVAPPAVMCRARAQGPRVRCGNTSHTQVFSVPRGSGRSGQHARRIAYTWGSWADWGS